MGASQSQQSRNKKTTVLAQKLRKEGHSCVTVHHKGQTARVLWCGNWHRCGHV